MFLLLFADFNSFFAIAETWITKTKHDLVKFWKNTVEDSEVLNEMLFTQGTMCNCENTIITLQKDSLVSTTSNSFRKCPSSVIKKSSLKGKLFYAMFSIFI